MVDGQLISNASQSLDALAKALSQTGDSETAERLFRQAADIELSSPELQSCWGGPFNGQMGRLALIEDLLHVLNPIAVVETGTYRGITTSWFAENYSGRVLSCEKETLYYLQAEIRLGSRHNADLYLKDSRLFLREIIPTFPHQAVIMFYLDAHWDQDLPLREELQIIFASHRNAVVVIDDFKVPDDSGYGWDDYGPGKSLDLELLDGVIPSDSRIFFPSMPSNEETGSVRGCCVIARDAATRVAESKFLRGAPFEQWAQVSRQTRATDVIVGSTAQPAVSAETQSSEAENENSARDTERRLEQARDLAARNEEWARDAERRLEEARDLAARNEEWARRTEAHLEHARQRTVVSEERAASLQALL